MRIIISPAKTMNNSVHTDGCTTPLLLGKTRLLKEYVDSLNYSEKKKLWNCSDKIALENQARFSNMRLSYSDVPAIRAYEGLQYRNMGPAVTDNEMLKYLQDHLRILSGFYGVLRPLDGIECYRLEMKSVIDLGEYKSLYDFWGKDLYDKSMDDSHIMINLASGEYSRCIERYLCDQDKYITCQFGEIRNDRFIQRGTEAKIMRGRMIRFFAENRIQTPEDLKSFTDNGYTFSKDRSEEDRFLFIKN